MINWISVQVLVVALVIAIAYLWIIRIIARHEWWPACHTLVSILVSVIVGLGIGFAVFQWQIGVEREAKREDLLLQINNELGVIEMDLAINGRDTLKLNDTSILINLTVLSSSVLRKASTSGIFVGVQSWRILALEAQINKHNIFVEFMMGLLTPSSYSPAGEKKVLYAHRRISKKQKNILNNCSLLREELGIDKNKYAAGMISKYGR